MPTVHVIGAGLAGLSAAVAIAGARRGFAVQVHEAARRAGGRCRSFHDATLDRVIDNGNHLILGANSGVFDFLAAIGARDGLATPEEAAFPFVDLVSGERWVLRPNAGRVPWWLLVPGRRVPGTRARDYLDILRLLRARPDATVAGCLDPGALLTRRLWEPLAVAVLNASLAEGSAQLLARVVRDTLGQGAAACRPYIAREGLSPALVDPAVSFLRASGVALRFNARLAAMDRAADGSVRALDFGAESLPLASDDAVVLAVPPATAARLVPGLAVPQGSRAIVNVHLKVPALTAGGRGGPEPRIVGLVGGVSQWLFLRGDIASVTVSAADALAEEPEEAILARVWPEVAAALTALGAAAGLPEPIPPARVVKEKRATFLQDPANLRLRPPADPGWPNLLLAGDWTDTGLPATIEGAIRSGAAAARAVLARAHA